MTLQEPNAKVAPDELPEREIATNHFVRVWFSTKDGLDSWDIDDVNRVVWTDDSVNIFYDMDESEVHESQNRYVHVNRDNLVGVKHIETPKHQIDD